MALAVFLPALGRDMQWRILRHWSCNLLRVLRLRVAVHGSFHSADTRGRMLVANHISWLDVLALNSIAPACFVAKSEVGGWPLLGWLCHRAGTLFIKRGVRSDARRVSAEISRLLKQGGRVTVFPEGTSTDGELPGHFHSALLQAAIDAECPIFPVAIRYHDGLGRASGAGAFVGDMSFMQSLWEVLRSPALHVDLFYLPAIPCAGKNRRLLAAEAQGGIHIALSVSSPHHTVCVPDAEYAATYVTVIR